MLMSKSTCPKNFQNSSDCSFHTQGFTIIELIIVVGLVGILSAILVSTINIRRQRDYANDGVRRQNLMDTAQAVETYFTAERSFPDQGAGNNPLTGTDSSIATQYIGIWPDNFFYNEDGSDFSIHVMRGSSTDYYKYSSTWQEIRECGPAGIDTVDTCAAIL